MGIPIGVEFALHQTSVLFVARDAPQAEHRIRVALDQAVDLGLADHQVAAQVLSAIRVVEHVSHLDTSVDLVLDCLPEDWTTKLSVMSEAAEHQPSATLATNTSSFSITALGEGIGAPDRTIGMHYWNPPLLMPLVEITAGTDTAPVAIDLADALVVRVGKTPVHAKRDVPGFIWNRLQMAVLREAWWLVEHGVASIDDIDTVTRLGLARRWRQVGLFGSVYLGNARQWETIAANLFPVLSNTSDAHGLADRVLAESEHWGDLGSKRDVGLSEDRPEES